MRLYHIRENLEEINRVEGKNGKSFSMSDLKLSIERARSGIVRFFSKWNEAKQKRHSFRLEAKILCFFALFASKRTSKECETKQNKQRKTKMTRKKEQKGKGS